MLMCISCGRLNPDDVEECMECGNKEFESITLLPDWLVEFENEQDGG